MSVFQNVKYAVSDARNEAYRQAKRECFNGTWLRSRGAWFTACDKQGSVWESEAYEWNGTKRQLLEMVAKAKADEKIVELSISGGFDGAASLQDFNDGAYDPWVGEWDVTIWERNPIIKLDGGQNSFFV